MLLTQGAPEKPEPIVAPIVPEPANDAERFAEHGGVTDTQVVEGAVIDVDTTPTVNYKVDDTGATSVDSNAYQIKSDGSEYHLGGAVTPAGDDYPFSIPLGAAWEKDVTHVHIVIRTVLTYPDGSTQTKETHFFRFKEPDPPAPSTLNILNDAPYYEDPGLHTVAYVEHTKTVDRAYLSIGLQQIPLTGGTAIEWRTAPSGNHDVQVVAYFKDGTESLSPVVNVTIEGEIAPAVLADLQQAVENTAYQTMLGPQQQSVRRADALIQSAITSGIQNVNYASIGENRANAYIAERTRWQAIANEQYVSPELKAVADAAIVALNTMIERSRLESIYWSNGWNSAANTMAFSNVELWRQYRTWAGSADAMTTPFVLVI